MIYVYISAYASGRVYYAARGSLNWRWTRVLDDAYQFNGKDGEQAKACRRYLRPGSRTANQLRGFVALSDV